MAPLEFYGGRLVAEIYPSSGVGWVVLGLIILMFFYYFCLFGLSHKRYLLDFSRDISGLLRDGDALLDQTLSVRDYVRHTPVSSVILYSSVTDIVRFDTRMEALIGRLRSDVRLVRLHRIRYITVLVWVLVMGFVLSVVGPWFLYVHAEVVASTFKH